MGGSSKRTTVGYRYFIGMHLILCHGPAQVRRIYQGERLIYGPTVPGTPSSAHSWLPPEAKESEVVWVGGLIPTFLPPPDMEELAEISDQYGQYGNDEEGVLINQPELYGGDEREGGFVGNVRFYNGEEGQGRSKYLARVQGDTFRPSYEGLCGVVLEQVYYASMNPYPKKLRFQVFREVEDYITPNEVSHPDNMIGNDANPASIIAEVLCNPKWSIGMPPSSLNTTSFTSARARLKTEEFGISLKWTGQDTAESFIQNIMDHINGSLYYDPSSGELMLDLIREITDTSGLLSLDESNVKKVGKVSRSAWGETVNEVTVIYTDTEGDNDNSITMQNMANVIIQEGQVINQTKDYRGVRNSEIASRLCKRDLKTLSTPLLSVDIVANRVAGKLRPGQAFFFSWEKLGVENLLMRVVDVDFGTPLSRSVKINAVEDSFAEQSSSYIDPTDILTVLDPVNPPIVPVQDWYITGTPYIQWVVENSEEETLGDGLSTTSVFMRRPSNSTQSCKVLYSSDDDAYYEGFTDSYAGNARLREGISQQDTSIPFTDDMGLFTAGSSDDTVEESLLNSIIVIGGELCELTGVNIVTQSFIVNRGLFDTPPQAHSEGEMVWMLANSRSDSVERATGSSVYYKMLPKYPQDYLRQDLDTGRQHTIEGRYHKPYCPGNVQVNGFNFPTEIEDDITISWAHRDRITQTGGFVQWTDGNVGPEEGVTYSLELVDDETSSIVKSLTGVTDTSYTYLITDEIIEHGKYHEEFTLRIWSERGGIASYKVFEVSFTRLSTIVLDPTPFNLTENGTSLNLNQVVPDA